MATVKTNIWDLKPGDLITFTNYAGSFRALKVSRVEEKSWYHEGGFRKSYGTLADYQKSFKDFKITRS